MLSFRRRPESSELDPGLRRGDVKQRMNHELETYWRTIDGWTQ